MNNNEIKNGLLMLAGFIAYFFFMKVLGLYTEVFLRVFHVFIHGTFVFLAMKMFRKQNQGEFDYLETFGVGMRASIIGVLGFSFFQFFYLQFIDPSFMSYIQENALMGSYLSPLKASIFLVMEGLGISILTSYVGMRILTITEKVPSLS